VSDSKKITVSRSFQPVPEDCSQALALLLKAPVRKEAAHPATPNDDAKESYGCIATDDYTS
jgi:hypothetical protein